MNLFYRRSGAGPPLIILHGLYGASDNWLTIGKVLSEYFEVFLIDQRNHGRSPHSEVHTYNAMKDDLMEFMEQQSIQKASLLGHSMGGKTVMFFASIYPEKVNNLIVVDISPESYLEGDKSAPHVNEHTNIINTMLGMDLTKINTREDAVREMGKTIKSGNVRQFLLKNLKRGRGNTFSWGLNLNVLSKALPSIMEGLDHQKFEAGRQVSGFPVLFVKGENSNYISSSDIPIIKKIFPLAEIITVPGSGHWVHVEQTDLFLKVIKDFLLS